MRIGKEKNNPIISKRYESLYKISFNKNTFSMRMLKKGAPVGRDTEGTDFPKHPLSNTPVNKGILLPALYVRSQWSSWRSERINDVGPFHFMMVDTQTMCTESTRANVSHPKFQGYCLWKWKLQTKNSTYHIIISTFVH